MAFQNGDLIGQRTQMPRHLKHQISALVWAQVAQNAAFIAPPRGRNSEVDIGRHGTGNFGDGRASGGIGNCDAATFGAVHPSAVHVVLPIGPDAGGHGTISLFVQVARCITVLR